MSARLGNLLKFASSVLLNISLEILLLAPIFASLGVLFLVLWVRSIPFLIGAAIFCYIFIPIFAALIQRAVPFKKRMLDLHFLVLLGMFAFSFLVWPPAIVVELGFCIFILGFAQKTAGRAKKCFLWTWLAAAALLILSGSFPITLFELAFLVVLTVSSLALLALYAALVGDEKLFLRPLLTLAYGLFYLTFIAASFHGFGRTAWLTRAVAGQQGVELLLAPSAKFAGPRAAIPVKDGLLIFTSQNHFAMLHDDKTLEKSPRIVTGRVDTPLCDPIDRSICYVPSMNRGLTVVNTSNWQAELLKFTPYKYDLVASDKENRYLAIMEEWGSYVGIAKILSPGKLEKIAEISLRTFLPDFKSASFLDFIDQKLLIIAASKSNVIHVFSFDPERNELRELAQAKMAGKIGTFWHGVTADGKLVVMPMAYSGEVLALEITGEKITKRYEKFLFPLIRCVLYDPQRKLCYMVSDLGYLIIFDPWNAKTIRKIFCGFKTKSINQYGNYLYIASSAGIFRVNIDEAIKK